ncbi:nucleoside triphosphate pyrophosphohydrolase family protein [Acetobacter fallax]|uniref:Phosphoribosyl-ATP pyrophosphatase n=1 Tax=Acetobacter fallax TaxID=1737473 RepID=A0ABX0KCS8_9PROT|nr:phosphoribosyl-ATP pyrophosphatase [Acetobacter fallax]NHO32683.1 phosphoribosyl-ATP pyrophosphatase [Acetobacter fallax]NHO36257.1 phosphoribosyl-ATP pyrophosphatase [Acetobacter fallax]
MTNRPTDAATGLSPLPARQVEEAGTDDTHAIAAEFGSITVECAIAAITGNSQGVVRGSAAFLEALFRLWSEQDLDPDAVWNELHARIEMGELSLRLSRASGRHRPRRVGPWRVATSKLP